MVAFGAWGRGSGRALDPSRFEVEGARRLHLAVGLSDARVALPMDAAPVHDGLRAREVSNKYMFNKRGVTV